MDEDKEIKYIAERYRSGRFSADKAWRRMAISSQSREDNMEFSSLSRWKRFANSSAVKLRRYRVAAVAGSIIVLTATAALVYRHYAVSEPIPTEIVQPATESPALAVKIIDFEETPLPIVIERIQEVYGVEIANIPTNANDYRLSLHYVGTAVDLIDTINDILDTDMTVVP